LLAFEWLLASALAAAPSYSVAVTFRVGVDENAGLEIAEEMSIDLENQGDGFPGQLVSPKTLVVMLKAANYADTASCKGAVDCAALMGKTAALDRIVGLQLVKVGSELVVEAALVEVRDGKIQGTVKSTMPFKHPEKELAKLAAELARKAPAWVPPPEATWTAPPPVAMDAALPPSAQTSDKPVAVAGSSNTSPLEAASPPADVHGRQPGWTPVIATAGGTVAAGVAAGVFGLLGLSVNSSVNSSITPGTTTSNLTPSQYQSMQADGNLKFTVAAVCASGAAVLAIVTVLLYRSRGSSSP
jgi:hypothetical protein